MAVADRPVEQARIDEREVEAVDDSADAWTRSVVGPARRLDRSPGTPEEGQRVRAGGQDFRVLDETDVDGVVARGMDSVDRAVEIRDTVLEERCSGLLGPNGAAREGALVQFVHPSEVLGEVPLVLRQDVHAEGFDAVGEMLVGGRAVVDADETERRVERDAREGVGRHPVWRRRRKRHDGTAGGEVTHHLPKHVGLD